MKIVCTIKRESGTLVELDGEKYDFQPNDKGEHVAEVTDKKHIATLLAIDVYKEHGKASAKKETPPTPNKTPIQEALQGLDWEPATVEFAEGQTITTAELVNQAFAMSGLSEKEWNALPKAEVEAKLSAEVELLADNTTPAPANPENGDDEAALRAEGKALKIPSYHLIGVDKLKAAIAEKKSGN